MKPNVNQLSKNEPIFEKGATKITDEHTTMDEKQMIDDHRIASLEKNYDKLNDKVDSSFREMTKAFADLRVDNAKFQKETVKEISKTREDINEKISKTREDINEKLFTQTKWFIGIIITIILSVFGSTIGILLKLSSH